MCAVPQSGPITSKPLSRPVRLSATSSSRGTLSLKMRQWSPLARARSTSRRTFSPGIEKRARLMRGSFPSAASSVGHGEIHERANSDARSGGSERRFHGGQFVSRRSCAVRLHGEDEVVRACALRLLCEQAARCELFAVHRRAHDGHRPPDPRFFGSGGADAHQLHRIVVRAG